MEGKNTEKRAGDGGLACEVSVGSSKIPSSSYSTENMALHYVAMSPLRSSWLWFLKLSCYGSLGILKMH